MCNSRFLVVIETQRVKGYLFASSILRETRGASLLLDQLNRTETRKLLESYQGCSEEIYLGGGSGRILFESKDKAEEFAGRVRELYRQKTVNARISVEVVRRDKKENGQDESVPDWMARGVRESQENKLGRIEAVPMLAGRWIRPCSSCGKEAARAIRSDIQGTHRLCTSCLYKRAKVRDFYHDDKRNWDISIPIPPLSKLRQRWPDFILTTLSETIARDCGKEKRICLPQDFDQIAEHSKPSNYIAFIYADGNRMGDTIKTMGQKFPDDASAKDAYRVFSQIVDQATREAAVRAVLQHVPKTTRCAESACFVPAEFVLAGGDDLILVVPANAALDVAACFISLYQAKTIALQQEWIHQGEFFAPKGLTTSAGVVIAHASYPASQLMDLAGELMKLAKRKAADLESNHLEGTLDFMVLHSAGSEKIKERREKEYKTHSAEGHALTERPYTATGAFKLLERIRALKRSDVPRTKLRALYPILFKELLQAQFEGLQIKERLKATGALTTGLPLEALVDGLSCFPFRKQSNGNLTTPLSELIELYDFVQPGATEASEEAAHG
ncbi:MAG: Cas10/Cmr2 second palm domain-containing protein [Gammaproteobacteria bacterium]